MRSFWLIAPYASWMALMVAMPATAAGYAVRTCVTAALLVPTLRARLSGGCRGLARQLAWGVPVGLAVFAVWILPEQFDWPLYGRFCIVGEGGTRGLAETGAALLAVRLFGSAFVISVAEELFFRKWLVDFAGFWWMVALFASSTVCSVSGEASEPRSWPMPRRISRSGCGSFAPDNGNFGNDVL